MTDERPRTWATVAMRPSWQQEGRLRRERLRGQVPFNILYIMRLPERWRPDDVTRHMQHFVSCHPSLSVDSIAESLVSFGPSWSGEIQHRKVGSVAGGIQDYLGQWGAHQFPRQQGPLWNMEFIDGVDGVAVAAVFDHLICDGWSLKLLRDCLSDRCKLDDDGDPLEDGIFDWLQWQRETYTDATSPTSAFWRDMFPDIPGNRAVALREFARPDGELSGMVRTHWFGIDLTREDVRRAARQQRVTSFMIWLAALAATIAESAGRDDINMMVTVPGRLVQHKAVFGWMADVLPVRFCEDGLGNPAAALEVVRKVWPQVLGHQSAPCDFVLEHACIHKRIVSRPALVTLNYVEDLVVDAGLSPPGVRDSSGDESGIHLLVGSAGESYALHVRGDVARFTDDGVAEFMGLVRTKMNGIVSAA
jgi:Condensation domain